MGSVINVSPNMVEKVETLKMYHNLCDHDNTFKYSFDVIFFSKEFSKVYLVLNFLFYVKC